MDSNQALTGADIALYKKIARLMLCDVEQAKIGEIVGLTQPRISQIKSDPRFQAIFAECAAESEKDENIYNKGWDAIEELGMAKVIDRLRYTHDPEFALKAATLANKANRRGLNGNAPVISAVDAGARVIVQLNQTFVERVQEMDVSKDAIPVGATVKKQSDMLEPARVEKLLAQAGPAPTRKADRTTIDLKNIRDYLVEDK